MAMALNVPSMSVVPIKNRCFSSSSKYISFATFKRKKVSITRCIQATQQVKFSAEFEAAVDAVERACQLCMNVRTKMNKGEGIFSEDQQRQKEDLTPVTVADYGVQALITLELGQCFEGVPLLGEEDGVLLQGESESNSGPSLLGFVVHEVDSVISSNVGTVNEDQIIKALQVNENDVYNDKYWILDPIDGTRGFMRGGDSQCVVGLALVEKGELVVGVMGLPFLPYNAQYKPVLKSNTTESENPILSRGILLAAVKNRGTWVREISWNSEARETEERVKERGFQGMVKVDVRRGEDLSNASICISDHETWDELPLAKSLNVEGIGEGLARNVLPLCCGSLCKYAAVALGEASIFIQHPVSVLSLKVWDHAAGVICVQEAGGRVTDFGGKELELENGNSVFYPRGGGVVVSNGELHDAVVERVRPTTGPLKGP